MLKGAETELVELLAVRLDDSGEDEGGTIKCLFRSSPGAYMAKMDRDGASDCCCKAWGVELNGVCPAQCMHAGVTARQRDSAFVYVTRRVALAVSFRVRMA